ncbi:acyclic terpene utilization AtuA family protein [Actinokineospora inagensis]|uniref:acyclic terpene utilization AtuA family protein n=1 Tax=Actinokineospora inagensis TaxID=103730 RepID=UPI00040E59AC|nr:acyclic terpene utilization AtuA family protein [Actinokineospora inagensis]
MIRIGNASGFYGDRFEAVHEMLTGGDLDVLTGDYLAELTMLILGRQRLADPAAGYAKTFLRQLDQSLDAARGVKIVTNAGGLNPAGLADKIRDLASSRGIDLKVACVSGDDLLGRGFDGALTANAYLGAWGIAACLRAGADIVVTGRVTDASLAVGPAAAHFGWRPTDFDQLASATVAGHVIECGTQATGGNFSFFGEIDAQRPGFPIAEVYEDGSSVITKHDGTGGAVTRETVTAQLLYEIQGADYLGPDVTTQFDTIALTDDGPNRVRISGVRGGPPPETIKVCVNTLAGFRNSATFVLCGLDIERKADLVKRQLGFDGITWTLARTEHEDADTEETASALLHATVKTSDPAVAKAFSRATVELALASYPGFTLTAPPSDGTPVGVYRPEYVDPSVVEHVAVLPDGTREPIPWTAGAPVAPRVISVESAKFGATKRLPLGSVIGARSGDKGGDANLGVWVRDPAAYPWLIGELTVDRLRDLLPETADLPVERHPLPNLRAVNFVVHGLLGAGVAAATRFDPQAKALGEWLRARHADIPEVFL